MTPTPSEELPRLGRYQVISKLAQGGMAEIFLAKALGVMGFERLVAIKLIHSHLTRDSEFVKMFIDEARIAMHLHHRNIVQVFDLDKAEDTYFIAMEYVHGVNLYDVYERIASKGRWVELPLALYIIAEVSKGLHFAHTRSGADGAPMGIVHRDISPQNVIVSFDGEVKITDFGIAKAAERLHQTTPGIVKGKYAYMAPEVLEDKPADSRVDVFAAGVVLYELLVGENPFAGASAVETIENVLHIDVPRPTSRGAPSSPELDAITLKALAKDPDQRYQSGVELAEALTDHGLNLTTARRDVAAGDAATATLLAELFPERVNLQAQLGASHEKVVIPMAESPISPAASALGSPAGAPSGAKDDDDLSTRQTQVHDARASSERRPASARGASNERRTPSQKRRPSSRADDPRTQDDTPPAEELDAGSPTLETAAVRSAADVEPITDQELRALDDSFDGSEDQTILSGGAFLAQQIDMDSSARLEPTPHQYEPMAIDAPERPTSVPAPIVEAQRTATDPASLEGLPPEAVADAVQLSERNTDQTSVESEQPEAPPPKSRRTALVAAVLLSVAVFLLATTLVVRTLFEEAGTVTIPITSTPTGASVSINGVTQPDRTPLHATVPVGRSHMIVISAEGHEAHTQEIQPVEGDTPVIHATLRQTPKP